MKLCLLTLMLVRAATVVQAEDRPLLLNQRFQLRYNQWQVNQDPASSATQAVYEVEAGIPIFTYRLGALALNGAVEYNRLAYGAQSDAETGLARYGARISLFPFRPFRLYLDYQRTQSPDLLGSGSVKGETWGAGATYSSRILQDVRLWYRHGDASLEGGANARGYRDDWSQWKLEAHQSFDSTKLGFEALRQDYGSLGTPVWRTTTARLDTTTHLSGKWVFTTQSQMVDNPFSRWTGVNATFYGPLRGDWHSLTHVSKTATTYEGAGSAGTYRTDGSFASESLVYGATRWSVHATGSYSTSDTPSQGQDSRTESLLTGASYALNPEWRVHGDVGLSTFQQTFASQDSSRNLTTMNVGIARGGDVPELIRHSLFFLSDWNFDRRVRGEYPPDYVPSELAQEMLRRRVRQTGSFGFAADLWRMSDSSTNGVLDWARVTGQLQTHGQLSLLMMGDYKHDRGMTLPGQDTRNTDLLINGSYHVGPATLLASMGYSSLRQAQTMALTPVPAPVLATPDSHTRNYSMGATSRVWKVPVGALWTRYDASMSPSTTTLSTWADLTFRQVSLRVRYQVSRMDGGFSNKSISVDLVRWFDTICVRNWR